MPWLQRQQSADRWDLMLISLMTTPCSQSLLIRGHSGNGTVFRGCPCCVRGCWDGGWVCSDGPKHQVYNEHPRSAWVTFSPPALQVPTSLETAEC